MIPARAPLTLGVALLMCSGVAVVGIGLLMYPILKPVNQRLAAGYAGLRVVELTVSAVCGAYLLTQLQVVPNHMLWVYVPTGIGGLILTYLLYTSRLVPRPVASARPRRIRPVHPRGAARPPRRSRHERGTGARDAGSRWAVRGGCPPDLVDREGIQRVTYPRDAAGVDAHPGQRLTRARSDGVGMSWLAFSAPGQRRQSGSLPW